MHRLRAMYRELYSLLQNTRFGWNVETDIITEVNGSGETILRVCIKFFSF